MKKCPFCAEDIQDEAVKCKHCGEFLEKKPKVPWYYSTPFLVIAILSVGPLALPLVWLHPQYSQKKKIVISVVVFVLTYFILQSFAYAMGTLNETYRSLTGEDLIIY